MSDLIKFLRTSTSSAYNKVAADRIEALTEQLAAAQQDAKEAEDYAKEVEADRKKTYEALLKVSRIHGEVEAKLATCEKYRDAYAECDRIGTQAVRDLEAKLTKAVEDAEKWRYAFAAQSRKLQAVLYIEGVKAVLAELEVEPLSA